MNTAVSIIKHLPRVLASSLVLYSMGKRGASRNIIIATKVQQVIEHIVNGIGNIQSRHHIEPADGIALGQHRYSRCPQGLIQQKRHSLKVLA